MRKTLAAAVLAVIMSLTAGGAFADASPSSGTTESTQLERVSAYTQPSVVYVGITWVGYVYDTELNSYLNKGNPFKLQFHCTGYVVNPDGYIATAGHCVDPAEANEEFIQRAAQWAMDTGFYGTYFDSVQEIVDYESTEDGDLIVVDIVNGDRKKGPVRTVKAAWSVSAGGVETGKALPARVVKWQRFDNGDGALLKVEADNLNALPLATDGIDIGTEVVAIGYPGSVDMVADQSFTPSYKDGAVSSKKTVSNGLLTVYEISSAVSGGMSGGPTVNLDGEVVGFNSFGINSDIETQQFNFVRPVETVSELLGDAGASNDLGEDGQNYRDGLDAFFARDKAEAVSTLQSVVDNQPTNELAQTYLEKAEGLPDPPEEDNGISLGLILGVVAGFVVLAALAIGVLLMMRRRKATPTPTPPGPPVPPVTEAAPSAAAATAGAPETAQGGATVLVAPPAPGAAPQQDTSGGLFCTNCGTRGEPEQKFCKQCGTAL